ncbi:MAG TPA: MBL fold metallo-hydrolase [Armatimonadota bacterium]|jgi:glyoxylase-like metal-dependent hydrolase (beta-lactamase superfamily II)
MLTLYAVPGAPLEVNCYLVADVEAGDALLIDAPLQVAEIMCAQAEELGVTIRQIVCTHGHWDHTMGLGELIAATGATVACHALDQDMLEHPSTAPFNLPFTLTPVTPDNLLEDDDVVEVGNHHLTVLHTPGHTPGCICLYDAEDGILFSGDTLFAGTHGRVDFPGSDPAQMVCSLQRLRALPADTRFYPGHGPESTIGRESWLANIE